MYHTYTVYTMYILYIAAQMPNETELPQNSITSANLAGISAFSKP